MTTRPSSVDALYKVRKGVVDIVDVPDVAHVAVDGRGDPNDAQFAEAVQALLRVAYSVHFFAKKQHR